MTKKTKIILIFFIIFLNSIFVSSSEIDLVCDWENKSITPCIEIKKKFLIPQNLLKKV